MKMKICLVLTVLLFSHNSIAQLYCTKKGDTLSKVARTLGTPIYSKDGTLQFVIKNNPEISDPDKIAEGQAVFLQGREVLCPESPQKAETTPLVDVRLPIEERKEISFAVSLTLAREEITARSLVGNAQLDLKTKILPGVGAQVCLAHGVCLQGEFQRLVLPNTQSITLSHEKTWLLSIGMSAPLWSLALGDFSLSAKQIDVPVFKISSSVSADVIKLPLRGLGFLYCSKKYDGWSLSASLLTFGPSSKNDVSTRSSLAYTFHIGKDLMFMSRRLSMELAFEPIKVKTESFEIKREPLLIRGRYTF